MHCASRLTENCTELSKPLGATARRITGTFNTNGDAYTLYDMAASGAAVMSRDDLAEIAGKRNAYMGEYGLRSEMPVV